MLLKGHTQRPFIFSAKQSLLTRSSKVKDVFPLGWVGWACLEDDVRRGHAGHRRGVRRRSDIQVMPGHRASVHTHLCGDDDDVATLRLAGVHQQLSHTVQEGYWLNMTHLGFPILSYYISTHLNCFHERKEKHTSILCCYSTQFRETFCTFSFYTRHILQLKCIFELYKLNF